MSGVDLQQQWDAVVAAPVLYLGAIIAIAIVIWLGVNYLKHHEISALEARLKLRDDELNDCKRKLAAANHAEGQPAAAPAPHHPDGIYQYGHRVGTVGGAQEKFSEGKIVFTWLRGGEAFDADANIEYRDFILKLEGFDTEGTVMMPGHFARQYGNAVCTILGRN